MLCDGEGKRRPSPSSKKFVFAEHIVRKIFSKAVLEFFRSGGGFRWQEMNPHAGTTSTTTSPQYFPPRRPPQFLGIGETVVEGSTVGRRVPGSP